MPLYPLDLNWLPDAFQYLVKKFDSIRFGRIREHHAKFITAQPRSKETFVPNLS